MRAIGRDPAHEPALDGTGARVADAYIDELCDGYAVHVGALLAESAIEGLTDIVLLRDLAVTTMCPHHLLPASGVARVAFAPRAKLVGIGTVVKLVDAFAHRLTLQETIGDEVTRALVEHLGGSGLDAGFSSRTLASSRAASGVTALASRRSPSLGRSTARRELSRIARSGSASE